MKRLTVFVATLALASCTATEFDQGFLSGDAWDVESAENLPVPEDTYLAALRDGYLAEAKVEKAEFDWQDAAEFRARAVRAAMGERFGPLDPKTRNLSEEFQADLAAAFLEMTAYVNSEGAMLRAPRQVGEAQVKFDCWLQEAEEGHQADDIAACRSAYEGLILLVRDLANLPDNMAVVLPEEEGGEIGGIELQQGGKKISLDRAFAAAGVGEKFGDLPVAEGEIRDAFADALAARPKPPKEFVLTFAFDSARISDEAFEQILLAADEARSRPAAEVIVTGFADAVGTPADNLAISRQRANVTAKAIFNELRDEESVTFIRGGKGERDLAVKTSRAEMANRRVVILVR